MIKSEKTFNTLKSKLVIGQPVVLEITENGTVFDIRTSPVEDFMETHQSLTIKTRNTIYVCYNHIPKW